MGPRAALVLTIFLCACGDTDSVSDMSIEGPADMGLASGADLATLTCVIQLQISSNGLMPPTLTAAATNALGADSIKWQVLHGEDAPMMPMTDSSGLIASWLATGNGTYEFLIDADVEGKPCHGDATYEIRNPTGALMRYRLRALPPESAGLPLADSVLPLYGGDPQLGVDIALGSGTAVTGTLRGPGNSAVAGEVRFISSDGPDAVTTTNAMGVFTAAVRSDGQYQPLLIPQSTTLAPHLGSVDSGTDFLGGSFVVTAGESVTGSVLDSAAAAIVNARVVLRAGALPSSVGISTATGAFTLQAEAGTYGLTAGSDDWPIATLSGVIVPAGGVNVAVAYTVARVAVGGSVTRADGTTPVAGTRVTIASRPLGNVANVQVGATTMPAQGHVLRQVVSDANGNLPSLQLPLGTYDLILEPPAGTTPEGLTAITRTLAGADTWTLPLHARNTLAGKISDGSGNGVGGVTVTVLELSGLGAALTTTSTSDGSYSLVVDSGAAMMVVFDPSADVKLSGAKLSLAAGSTSADVILPAGLQVSGTVRGPSGSALGSVIVEALCYSCGADTVITSGFTDSNGMYKIYLPDPGNIIVDLGATD